MRKTLLIMTVLLISISCSKDPDNKPESGLVVCFEIEGTNYVAKSPISFNSCSENATNYLWTFGDGGQSTEQNPSYTYQAGGEYTIKLTVSNDLGEESETQIINVAEAPTCITHTDFINTNQTWSKGCHIVENAIYVENGAILTIEPGAIVKFKNAGRINVAHSEEGQIVANGTEQEPIIFTSFAENPEPGNWDGISVGGASSSTSSFKYCVFEYGGYNLFGEPSAMIQLYEGGKSIIDHCEFRKSFNYAIELDSKTAFQQFTNNYIHDIESFALLIAGNHAGSIGEGNNIENKGVLIDINQVTQTTEWRGLNCPYVTKSNLWVGSDGGNTLTLGEGVRIEFQNTQMLLPNYSTSKATLICNGTAQKPVVFTSHTPEESSRWGGIQLGSQFTADSYFRYTIFEHAQNNTTTNAVISVGNTTLNMENCTISGAKAYGIAMGLEAQLGAFTNNDFGALNSYSMNLRLQNITVIGTTNTFSGGKNVQISFNEVTHTATWPALPVEYVVDGDIYVGSPEGNTLTLSPGLKLSIGGTIYTDRGYSTMDARAGILKAIGISNNPIIIKRKTGVTGGDIIDFSGEQISPENILEYCQINGGSIGVRIGYIYNDISNPYPVVRNCTITGASNFPIYVAKAFPLLENNTFSGNGTDEVKYQE